VVCEESRGVILLLDRRFVEQREGPGDFQILRRPPFCLDSFEGFPGALRHWAIQEAMSKVFLCVRIAHFALRGKAYLLELGPNREAFVENQPDERAHLPWACVMPESGRHLSGRGVSEVEILKEGHHAGREVRFANVVVAPLGSVPVERGIAQGQA
jgi:hypothetical protein